MNTDRNARIFVWGVTYLTKLLLPPFRAHVRMLLAKSFFGCSQGWLVLRTIPLWYRAQQGVFFFEIPGVTSPGTLAIPG